MLEEEKALVDFLIGWLGMEEDTLYMITGIFGFNVEVLENILYYKTGYHSLDQLPQFEKGEY